MCDAETSKAIDQLLILATKQLVDREPIFASIYISDTQGWQMDYRNRKHVYMWLPAAYTLNLGPEYGSGAVQAQVWINLGIKTGIKIVTVGQANPVEILLKFTDEVIP